ncbi:MAG: hypothetical protein K2N88_02415 [Muribaculaceae bacterium]|nr:hypothetical protein [Muribaculaceae bacterium]
MGSRFRPFGKLMSVGKTIVVVLLAFYVHFIACGADRNDRTAFIGCELQVGNVYEHQPVTATVMLYTEFPEIAYISRRSDLQLDKGEFEVLRQVNIRRKPERKEIKGRQYYAVPLETFVISFPEAGNYSLTLPTYEVGLSEPVIVDDPFWGRVRSSRTVKHYPSASKQSVKVRKIPRSNNKDGFAGSVGEFSIRTELPPGDIFAGEEAVALLIISGPGTISTDEMPEYRSAFSDGVRLKSVSDERKELFADGRMVTEFVLEMIFIPESEKNAEIGPVSFRFFNTASGKFEVIQSDPITVEVKSTTAKRDRMSV